MMEAAALHRGTVVPVESFVMGRIGSLDIAGIVKQTPESAPPPPWESGDALEIDGATRAAAAHLIERAAG